MADQLQLRGGTTAEHATFTGALREVTVDTDKDTVVVHDNATAGGHPLAKENLSNVSAATAATKLDGQTVKFGLGAAATPSVTFNGDLNTGVYSPGADQVAISTGGSGRLFVDSVGNIGANVSPFAYAANARNLQINATGYSALTFGTTDGGTGEKYWRWIARTASPAKSLILQTLDDAGGGEVNAYTIIRSGTAIDYQAWNTGGFERLRITSAGLVGVGTSSPTGTLTIYDGGNQLHIDAPTSSNSNILFRENASTRWIAGYVPSITAFRFSNGSTDVLALTNAGRVGIGTSSPAAILSSKPSASSTTAATTFTGDGLFIDCANTTDGNGNYGGAISWSRSGSSTTRTAAITNVQTGSDSDVQGLAFLTHSSGTSTNPLIEAMRITGAGLVGIGTTSPTTALHVKGIVRAHRSDDANPRYIQLSFEGGTSSLDTVRDDGQTSAIIFRQSSDNGSTYSERARIDTSGRLLVGTSSSPSAGDGQFSRLTVQGSVGGDSSYVSFARNAAATSITVDQGLGLLAFTDNAGNTFGRIACQADANAGAGDYPGRLVFSTTADGASSPTERMRITNAGAVVIGTTTAYGADGTTIAQGEVFSRKASNQSLTLRRDTTDGTIAEFRRDATAVGTISVTTTATAYNTSSDYRLKENVIAVTDGITRLQQLKPSRFNFIADPTKTVDGFIAHEVQTVVPEAITGKKDAVDDEGNPQYQGIDQSKLVPLLTAALQEAVAKIESLEARLTAAGI